jgi:hypothetical protein
LPGDASANAKASDSITSTQLSGKRPRDRLGAKITAKCSLASPLSILISLMIFDLNTGLRLSSSQIPDVYMENSARLNIPIILSFCSQMPILSLIAI